MMHGLRDVADRITPPGEARTSLSRATQLGCAAGAPMARTSFVTPPARLSATGLRGPAS
jgi:hypothetical protein